MATAAAVKQDKKSVKRVRKAANHLQKLRKRQIKTGTESAQLTLIDRAIDAVDKLFALPSVK